MFESFSEVVEHEFLKSLGVELFGGDHFAAVVRFLGFDDHTYGGPVFVAIVDDQVVFAFGVDIVVGVVVGFFEEVGDQVFVKLFGFAIFNPVYELDQVGFEPLNIRPIGFYFQEGFVEGLAGFQWASFHAVAMGSGRVGGIHLWQI